MEFNIWTQIVGLSGSFGLGMCFALLGSIAVKLMPRMKIDQAKFGTMVSIFMFCCLVASLAVGTLMDALGYQTVAIIGFVAAAIAFFLLGNAKDFNAAIIASVLLGVGAMACNTTGNVLGTGVFTEAFKGDGAAANNLVNVFFGLGLFLTPFVISFLFQKLSYEKAISIMGLIILAPAVFALIAKYPAAKSFSLGDAVALLAEPATIVAALVLFCYIALESSFTNWLAPFGKEVLSKEKPDMPADAVDASAARMLSAFAIAMMAGRLLTSLSGVTAMGGYLIALAAVVAAILIVAMMVTKSSGIAYVLAALSGLAFAPAFPTTVGVTFGKFGGGSGSLFGIIFAIGLLGAVIVPKAIGNMAKGSSVQKSLRLLLPACVLLVALALGLHYVKGPASKAATQPAVQKVDDAAKKATDDAAKKAADDAAKKAADDAAKTTADDAKKAADDAAKKATDDAAKKAADDAAKKAADDAKKALESAKTDDAKKAGTDLLGKVGEAVKTDAKSASEGKKVDPASSETAKTLTDLKK